MQRVISHRVWLSLIVYSSTSQIKCLQIPCNFLSFEGNTIWTGVTGPVMTLSVVFIDLSFICEKSGHRFPLIFFSVTTISFPELRSPWPAVGKRELWEHPFSNNNENNRILHIQFYCACVRSAQSACMVSIAHAWNGCSQSSRFPTAGQGERSSGNEIAVTKHIVLIEIMK